MLTAIEEGERGGSLTALRLHAGAGGTRGLTAASHQRVDGQRHPWTLATPEKSPMLCQLLEREQISNGGVEIGLMKGDRTD
ncbi:hypothetical protein EVAR_79817_1 [Eumeta japonica]|uniref:Uncharacterized protein n=1 Tax=Eumeta variegata TaxID=151549 RepID=A0A4C1WQP4_EUMVA|nr:hypothetical protein EVAR_79817_1 [Eumeta japonica]